MKLRIGSIVLAGILAAGLLLGSVPVFAEDDSSAPSLESALPEEDIALYKSLGGTWEGTFHVVTSQSSKEKEDGSTVVNRTYVDDRVVMNFVNGPSKQNIYLTVDSCNANYLTPRSWSVDDDDNLVIVFNDKPWQAVITVGLTDEALLEGTYQQYGNTYPIKLRRTSKTPVNKGAEAQFMFEDIASPDWYKTLAAYPSYAEKGAGIPYTYELGRTSQADRLIKLYRLDELTKDQSDVQKMETLLNLVSDTFKHDGAVELPEKNDALSLIQYSKEKGGVECRGLSIILSEMLRALGIPAKPIMCIPANDPCEDCHVVVHAYSYSQKQWVMLDPTYQVVLRNKDGRYVSLPMLRDILVKGEPLTVNATAGRNNRPFYMEHYRAYMTKNCFRFSSATEVSFGTEFQTGRKENMLLPVGYQIPFAGYRTETLTTCANEFWAAPPAPTQQPSASSSSSSNAE